EALRVGLEVPMAAGDAQQRSGDLLGRATGLGIETAAELGVLDEHADALATGCGAGDGVAGHGGSVLGGHMLLAMSWEAELRELRRREELARRMGGEERVERQHR